MTTCFFAVDIGTSSSKGTVIDTEANILAEEFILHSDISPALGHHEHDAEKHWWGEFVTLVRRILNKLDDSTDIASICVSGMWPTFCPTDADGTPLHNAILYNDSRSNNIAKLLLPNLGTSISGYEYLPRLIWLQQNTPTIWSKTKKIFTTHNFIVYRLTGEYCIDSLTASVLGNLFDGEHFKWRDNYIKDFGISLDLLPKIYSPSTIAGYISESASKLTGLKSGTPVITGAGDSLISIIGAGAHLANDGAIYYGSLGMFVYLTKDIEYILETKSFTEGDGIQWLLCLPDSGKQLEWAEKFASSVESFGEEELKWKSFERLASMSELGASGVVFVHNLEKHDEVSIALSPRAGIIGITTNTTTANISRAVLESFGYALRKSLEDSKLSPESFNRVFASGGGAQSNLWRKIVSEIIQIPQYYHPTSTGAIGGCMLGAHAVGAIRIKDIAKYRITKSQFPTHLEKQNPLHEVNYQLYKQFSESIEKNG